MVNMGSGLFQEGENRVLRPPNTILVIFGATGDLTYKKLIPALYNLEKDGYLPDNYLILGAARTPLDSDGFRKKMRAAIQENSRSELDVGVWNRFEKRLFYQAIEINERDDFKKLKSTLDAFEVEHGQSYNYLFYLATSPALFIPVAKSLHGVQIGAQLAEGPKRSSVIVEKPFGLDLDSACELNKELQRYFLESQIYRIDHYLGKETVQNILVFRFANGIFEPLWSKEFVDHIQISVCESIGIGSRASYFDEAGILRDIIQNHLLQMLALVCIEPPLSLSDAASIRDEKVKVLRSIKRLDSAKISSHALRAQYEEGYVNGQQVKGYKQEEGVPKSSHTETYAMLALEVDNWRWSGVPIYVRAGKRLPRRVTEIAIYFKAAPQSLFQGRLVSSLQPNYLSIQVQPEEGISFCINSKPPGPRLRAKPVLMDFHYRDSFGVASPEAYERLLLDSMKHDPTLFTRNDEIEESWSLLEPILDAWGRDSEPLYTYRAGSWGPGEASDILALNGHRWRTL